jgi:hypothetical protein
MLKKEAAVYSGCEVDYSIDPRLFQQSPNSVGIAYIAPHKAMTRLALQRPQGCCARGIRQLVEVDHPVSLLNKQPTNGRPDKASPSSDQNGS